MAIFENFSKGSPLYYFFDYTFTQWKTASLHKPQTAALAVAVADAIAVALRSEIQPQSGL